MPKRCNLHFLTQLLATCAWTECTKMVKHHIFYVANHETVQSMTLLKLFSNQSSHWQRKNLGTFISFVHLAHGHLWTFVDICTHCNAKMDVAMARKNASSQIQTSSCLLLSILTSALL